MTVYDRILCGAFRLTERMLNINIHILRFNGRIN